MVTAKTAGLALEASTGETLVVRLTGAWTTDAHRPSSAEVARRLESPPKPRRVAFEAERSLMARLGGGCALPLGALATVSPDGVRLVALVASPDGTRMVRVEAEAATPGGAAETAAAELLAKGAGEILADVRP